MRQAFGIFLILFISIEIIHCDEPPNKEEVDENYAEISAEICKNELSSEKQAEIEKCHQLDPYYKFDVSLKIFEL